MTTLNALALVVEPPLPVANTLLDEARRLAGRLAGSAGFVTWMRPHRYAAPLAVMVPAGGGRVGQADRSGGADRTGDPPDAGVSLDPMLRALDLLVRGREEFAVQLGPIGLEPCGDGAVVASRLVSARPEDLAVLVEGAARHLGDLGMRPVEVPAIRMAVGLVGGEGRDAVRAAIEPKETPIAGWLLGGVCLARAWVDPEAGLVEAERVRFAPLKRLGSRR